MVVEASNYAGGVSLDMTETPRVNHRCLHSLGLECTFRRPFSPGKMGPILSLELFQPS